MDWVFSQREDYYVERLTISKAVLDIETKWATTTNQARSNTWIIYHAVKGVTDSSSTPYPLPTFPYHKVEMLIIPFS